MQLPHIDGSFFFHCPSFYSCASSLLLRWGFVSFVYFLFFFLLSVLCCLTASVLAGYFRSSSSLGSQWGAGKAHQCPRRWRRRRQTTRATGGCRLKTFRRMRRTWRSLCCRRGPSARPSPLPPRPIVVMWRSAGGASLLRGGSVPVSSSSTAGRTASSWPTRTKSSAWRTALVAGAMRGWTRRSFPTP
ncbi:uncharacterized protein Tco025E_00071 [Trypanosoma conorhini]|uniref:Uncharacterized protein n=1 Tax=Trypanosoma conorhini TaxID=83891 RepID=A0A3R7M6V2_9TRYP|nr:uncharacterized protein Tco025E_00071 [Trypanosoma conorhini]RNF27687.1 hypothetical protein Tco025E_00071 [Trypanosoma conorhini]